MDRPYVTVTVEVSSDDEDAVLELYTELRRLVRAHLRGLRYADLDITYQDQEQLDTDAQVEADTESDAEAWFEG